MASNLERLIRKEDKRLVEIAGIERTYLYYEPEDLSPEETLSILMILHGGGANGENAMRMAQAEQLADERRCLILYPDGFGKKTDRVYTWNAGNCCGLAKEANSDDVLFLRSLLQIFAGRYRVAKDRVMVAGFSNGAMMAHRFAIEASDCVSSIAAVSGGISFHSANPQQPVSLLSVHGLLDTHAPYKGGCGRDTRYPREDRPIAETIQSWIKWNGCRVSLTEKLYGENVILHQHTDGVENSAVHEYVLPNQGHAWPGGKPGLRYGNVDQPFESLHITKIIYDFMELYPRMTAL